MLFWRKFKIRGQERGLLFRDDEFEAVLGPGTYWYFDPLRKIRVDVEKTRVGWIERADLDVLVRTGYLDGEVEVIDLSDRQRALVWFDDRFERVLGPGLYAVWTNFRRVRVEMIDVGDGTFRREDLTKVLAGRGASDLLDVTNVEAGSVGVVFRNGEFLAEVAPGTYAFWRGVARFLVRVIDERERVQDVSGQEIMTADRVTLRMNAVVTYRVVDARKAVSEVESYGDALYREAQLALRAAVGGRELDQLLTAKEALAAELAGVVRARASAFGLEVVDFGIRDVILPGEMKTLLNQVTEAKKAAEASLITRREETAAMRSQANTAKILEGNPTLMRLRELETLEKVAGKANLNVVLGEQGLVDRVVKLL